MLIQGRIGHEDRDAWRMIQQYATSHTIDSPKSHHVYESAFPAAVQPGMNALKYGSLYREIRDRMGSETHYVETIDSMNELYVSASDADGSDRVFETHHVDGPFLFLPWCRVFRCIVGLTPNQSVITHFPSQHAWVLVDERDFVAFDYNRDIHSIFVMKQAEERRMTLKLHYICCPYFVPRWWVRCCKALHVGYNSVMRALFLQSQLHPTQRGWGSRALAWTINTGTVAYCRLVQRII